MTFRRLIRYLEKHIGNHQIPTRRNAHEIREFLRPDGVHHDLVKDVVRRIYKTNNCGHLDAVVRRPATLGPLAEIRLEIMHSPRTDIDQYRFIEELYARATKFFDEHDPDASPLKEAASHGASRHSPSKAKVIYF